MIKSGQSYYFRGHRRTDWKLQTTFQRYAELINLPLNDYIHRVLPEVAYQVSSLENYSINLKEPDDLGVFLAQLQHHGFPTPLLDWTLSPYIAAYFAFKDIDPRNPDTKFVDIYIFDIGEWSKDYTQPFNFDSGAPFISAYRPKAIHNPRMSRQLGVTTATNIPDLLAYLTGFQKHYLYRTQIPVNERKVVMNELNLMGINSMTMFPDLTGLCDAMKEVFFNNVEVKPLMAVPPPPPKT